METTITIKVFETIGFNLVILFFFWFFGIYKFNHDNVMLFGGGGIHGCYSRLKLIWRIITTLTGIIFSPALLILYCIFKVGNTNCGEYTKKYSIFFERKTHYCDSNIVQMF